MVRREIKNLIEKAIKEFQKASRLPEFEIPAVKVEHPQQNVYGDYSTNIALVIGKRINRNPLEVAENLRSLILNLKSGLFDKVEIAKPGFVNFFLSERYLAKEIEQIFKEGKDFGKLNIGRGKKTNLEFISANPTGPLHVGNGRGAFLAMFWLMF